MPQKLNQTRIGLDVHYLALRFLEKDSFDTNGTCRCTCLSSYIDGVASGSVLSLLNYYLL